MKNDITLHIKNMVCPRCTSTVQSIFNTLNIDVKAITLGEVIIASQINNSLKIELETKLSEHGFELLQDHNSKIISQIKALIVDHIHHNSTDLKINFSSFLSEKLNHEYTSLSKLFSSVEGLTIERFILKQKIEKVKEFLFYNELNLSEIAFRMNYSSTAHLSSQFKKETGMTPSTYKKSRKPSHRSLDSI